MKTRSGEKIKLASIEELLGVVNEESAMDIEIAKIHSFKSHPFKVLDDERMQELVESVKEHGILTPVLLRPCGVDEYEMISGHRRMHAAQLAGLTTVPSIIREMDDDAAVVFMVDSNIQRENILPSEKAFAYKMKMEALKHQGIKGSTEGATAELVGNKAGDSGRKVQRYIRLTELLPELLEMVDKKKLNFISAVALSYLTKEEQEWVFQCIAEKRVNVAGTMAEALKKYSMEKTLTRLAVELTLCKEKKDNRKLIISEERVNRYFPADYSREQKEEVICMLLEKWSMQEKQEE